MNKTGTQRIETHRLTLRPFHRIELNMWEFNRDALAFYEAAGYTTFRRYMEMMI